MDIKVFTVAELDALSREARCSNRRRQHQNIHKDYSEPCQRFFNAIEPDSYLRPHRHGSSQGPETMVAIRGFMTLVVFDEEGKIRAAHTFGAGRHVEERGIPVGVETPPGRWHTVVSLEPSSILLEIKAGPFDPDEPKVMAPWAPEEGSPEAANYLAQLRADLSTKVTHSV